MAIEETLCPDCGGPMVSRKSQYGIFWGCASYPKCKGTRDSEGRSKADREKWKEEQWTKHASIDEPMPPRPKKRWEIEG